MGLTKQWLLEQAEEERHAEFRAWFRDRFGHGPTDADEAKYWDDFELAEAMDHAMDKDD
jgi:hypothetical protein